MRVAVAQAVGCEERLDGLLGIDDRKARVSRPQRQRLESPCVNTRLRGYPDYTGGRIRVSCAA